MGVYFSPVVENLFKDIFQSWDREKIQQAQSELQKIVDTDPIDGDACVLLSRTFAGRQFVWGGAKLLEDDSLCYKYLHKGILQGSAVGILQALRMEGGLTPSIKKRLPMTLGEAFIKVLNAAELGDPFCQYIIGNVYYWGDYKKIGGAAIAEMERFKTTVSFWQRLKEYKKKKKDGDLLSPDSAEAQSAAIYWLEKSVQNGFILFPGNLRNLYLARRDYDKAYALAESMARQGNPEMMYWHAIHLAKDLQNLEEAIVWYEKGAALGDAYCYEELGDIYFWQKIPDADMAKGVAYYEKSADLGNTYCMVQCVYAYAIGEGTKQDWGRAGFWVDKAIKKIAPQRYMDLLPFLTYMLYYGYGMRQNKTLACELLLQVEVEAQKRHLSNKFEYWPPVQKLWQDALYDAVQNNEIEKSKIKNYGNWLDSYEPMVEAQSDTQIHTQIDAQLDTQNTFQTEIDKLSNALQLLPKSLWYGYELSLSIQPRDEIPLHRTSLFDWEQVENQLTTEGLVWLFINRPFRVGEYLSNLLALGLCKHELDEDYEVALYGSIELDDIYYEVRYTKTLSLEKCKDLLFAFYSQKSLPDLVTWEKQYWDMESDDHAYILEVDREEFYLDDYEDSSLNLLDALLGIRDGVNQTVFVYLQNLSTGGLFIYKNPEGPQTFLIHAIVPVAGRLLQSENAWELRELKTNNVIELHLWLENFVAQYELPDILTWKKLPIPKDGAYKPIM